MSVGASCLTLPFGSVLKPYSSKLRSAGCSRHGTSAFTLNRGLVGRHVNDPSRYCEGVVIVFYFYRDSAFRDAVVAAVADGHIRSLKVVNQGRSAGRWRSVKHHILNGVNSGRIVYAGFASRFCEKRSVTRTASGRL